MSKLKRGTIQRGFVLENESVDLMLDFLATGLRTHRSAIVNRALKEFAERHRDLPGVAEELAKLAALEKGNNPPKVEAREAVAA